MLIERFDCQGMCVSLYDSVSDLAAQLWDATLADGHPYRTHAFMTTVEAVFPQRQYRYWRLRGADDALLALGFSSLADVDPLADVTGIGQRIVSAIRRGYRRFGLLKVAMLGCYETSGRHWWIAPGVEPGSIHGAMAVVLERAHASAKVLVYRDIEHGEASAAAAHDVLTQRGYAEAANYPLALILTQGRGWDAHCAALRSNCRKIINKALADFRQSGFTIEHHRGQVSDLPRLYALYANTHAKAVEFKRELLPYAFLERLISDCDSIVSVLYDTAGQAQAFILTGVSETVLNPFLFGRDYHAGRTVNAYYVLHAQMLEHCAGPQVRCIDLGITNYFVKQNFGATLAPNAIYIRLRHAGLNGLLGKHIAKFFAVEQPAERSGLKRSAQA